MRAGEQGKDQLESICQTLNSTEEPELRDNMRRLVQRWQASGPNLAKMMDEDSDDLHGDVQTACRARWEPTLGGRAHLVVEPDYREIALRKYKPGQHKSGQGWPLTPEGWALILFHFLTLNPHCEKLAGPCARCGSYYVKKRASQKVYCSRRCGNAATAVIRTREKLAAKHTDKLRRATAAARKWTTTRTSLDWKRWVSDIEPDITSKFLTRAVNQGVLKSPVRRLRTEKRK
jgi:hypothetical protein